ncbi:alpha- and gamma-adaptin-binding protein p34-like [Ischnura elegans]|uniref:alpha- and gamma-adaptin-binding protein p34-like n=1 Tax=Ischnura elegans TaxID=197161 RepID=UPI001ED8BB3E|nr:alpha- and gamma-adaptin-binding protein p34-like [Ischnura elegans]XP_046399560.1 alpha- and gamma-adaptin-binding protein p34-like [Ischnura elegans]XP_046399561.1 alpha- and gamma-adaptin-binding protein p34-like [Ischnura elegans]XP_046399562.1 alpha- and gamma-adaptin-binding protein p34-like [Ischnura elegans]XP_046399563.1 alpha- and gamma-adaptin-binding protein p34-like [Ischnura elegans]XP_046399564.1 alpha- and gamma-adaptin-binding protein p34-like [Ischnura elegans]
MDTLPAAVVVSCTSRDPNEIVKLILNEDELPGPDMIGDNINAYKWSIETKYYSTDIYLCSMLRKALESQEFSANVEAIIIYFDSFLVNGLEVVESWMPFTNVFESEINILLCERCGEDSSEGVSKIKAQEWCVKNGFELVELDPHVASEDEEYELDFQETTGIKRVVQALHAHMWPNLVLKEGSQQISKKMQNLLIGEPSRDNVVQEEESSVENGGGSTETNSTNSHAPISQEIIDRMLCGSLEMSGDELPDSYGDILENLHDMKERVQGLPSEQRKAAAEKVVMAFWRALGGEEDEIAGLSDPEET